MGFTAKALRASSSPEALKRKEEEEKEMIEAQMARYRISPDGDRDFLNARWQACGPDGPDSVGSEDPEKTAEARRAQKDCSKPRWLERTRWLERRRPR